MQMLCFDKGLCFNISLNPVSVEKNQEVESFILSVIVDTCDRISTSFLIKKKKANSP